MASVRNWLLTRPWALQTFKFSHIFCLFSKALSMLPKTWLISNNICQIDWKPSDITKSNKCSSFGIFGGNLPFLHSTERLLSTCLSRACWQCSSSYQYLKYIWAFFFLLPPIFPPLEFILSLKRLLDEATWKSSLQGSGCPSWHNVCYNHVMQRPTTIALHTCKYTLYVVGVTSERSLKVISYSWISLVFQELCCLYFLLNFNWQ